MAIVMRTSPFGVCHFFAFLLSFTRRENTQLLYSAFAKQYTTLSLMSYYCWCEYVLRFLKSSALRYDLLYSIAMFAISLLSLHFIPVTMLRYLRQKQTATKLSKKKERKLKKYCIIENTFLLAGAKLNGMLWSDFSAKLPVAATIFTQTRTERSKWERESARRKNLICLSAENK